MVTRTVESSSGLGCALGLLGRLRLGMIVFRKTVCSRCAACVDVAKQPFFQP